MSLFYTWSSPRSENEATKSEFKMLKRFKYEFAATINVNIYSFGREIKLSEDSSKLFYGDLIIGKFFIVPVCL